METVSRFNVLCRLKKIFCLKYIFGVRKRKTKKKLELKSDLKEKQRKEKPQRIFFAFKKKVTRYFYGFY